MAGRHPAGPEYVGQLEGSEEAKRRLRIVLETMTGQCGIQEAARLLEVSEQRVHQLRETALSGALAALEPKPAGRRRRPAQAADATALQEQVTELEKEVRAAQVRERLALFVQDGGPRPEEEAASQAGKKTRPKRRATPG